MILDTAREYVAAGISVIPLLLDGSKAPALPAKVPQIYSQRLPTDAELVEWFGRIPRGIGMKCGAVSRGLEVIDFDMWQTFAPWSTLIPQETFAKLSIVETPGGFHAIYRCREICGNRKIAMWEPPQCLSQRLSGHRECTGFQSIGKGPRIESRGEGGYVVAEGSPCRVHGSGIPYVQACGPKLPHVETISPEERRSLWLAAAEFDCAGRESKRVKQATQALKRALRPARQPATGDEPWDWFDAKGHVDELLRKHGWQSHDDRHWLRPGKTLGTSAVLSANDGQVPILTVFSTSAGPLSPQSGEAHRSFGPFALLTALDFGGDRARAASFVRKELMRL